MNSVFSYIECSWVWEMMDISFDHDVKIHMKSRGDYKYTSALSKDPLVCCDQLHHECSQIGSKTIFLPVEVVMKTCIDKGNIILLMSNSSFQIS